MRRGFVRAILLLLLVQTTTTDSDGNVIFFCSLFFCLRIEKNVETYQRDRAPTVRPAQPATSRHRLRHGPIMVSYTYDCWIPIGRCLCCDSGSVGLLFCVIVLTVGTSSTAMIFFLGRSLFLSGFGSVWCTRQPIQPALFSPSLSLCLSLSPDSRNAQVRLDNRVLKVVENRVVSALSKELLIETLQVS